MMRRPPPPVLLCLSFLALGGCQAAPLPPSPPQQARPVAPYASDRVILGLAAPLSREALEARLRPLGFTVLRPLMDGIYLVGLPEGMDVPTAVERLQALPEVRYAEPDYLRRPYAAPAL